MLPRCTALLIAMLVVAGTWSVRTTPLLICRLTGQAMAPAGDVLPDAVDDCCEPEQQPGDAFAKAPCCDLAAACSRTHSPAVGAAAPWFPLALAPVSLELAAGDAVRWQPPARCDSPRGPPTRPSSPRAPPATS